MLRLRPAKPLLGFIVPCLPSPADRPPSGPNWIHEIKHDGYRLMAWRAGDRVRLLTRNGVDWTARFPLIYAAVAALKARSCLIDGKRSAAMKTASQSSISCAAGGTTIACSYPLYDLLELDGRRKSIRHGRCVGS